jgi:hypothetical protein
VRSVKLLPLLAVASCTHAPWHPYRGWMAVRDENVVLYTDTLVEHRAALDWMVAISEAYQRTFFRDLPVRPMHVVYLQEDAPSPLLRQDGNYRYGAAIAALPRATDGGSGLILVGRFSWQWQYAHFVAHHFIFEAMPAAPLWFQEGFADYLSVFRSAPDNPGVLCFGLRQPSGEVHVSPPLASVFAATWHDFNDDAAQWMKPASWGVVDYLLHGDQARWRPRFRVFFQALVAGKGTEAALAEAYPDLRRDTLEERIRLHVRTIRPPNAECPLPVVVGPRTAVGGRGETPVPEAAMRGIFEAIARLPGQGGYADFWPR